MAGLGHAETAEHIQVDQRDHILFVMGCGTQVFDRATKQAPLHARLDHQRQVRVAEHLNADDRSSDVAGATMLRAESGVWQAMWNQLAHDPKRPRAGLLEGQRWVGEQVGAVQVFACGVADRTEPSVERDAQIRVRTSGSAGAVRVSMDTSLAR